MSMDWMLYASRVTLGLCVAGWLSACGPEVVGPTTSEGASTGEDSEASAGESAGSESGSTGPEGSTTSAVSTSTGGSVTTDGITDGSAGTTDSCPFICEPDIPQEQEWCDIFAQDCPEGQKCASVDTDGDGAWDKNTCVEIMGDGVVGEDCTAEGASGLDTCAEGHMCWNLDQEGNGTCVANCLGSAENPSCPDEDCTSCIISSGPIAICLPGCDPLEQDCYGSEVCIGDPNSDQFVCVLDASGGMAPAGTPCEFANVCNPGTMCANPDAVPHPDCEGSIGCCTPFCDYEQPGGACDVLGLPGVECVPYHEEPVENCAGAVGVCVVP